MTLFIQTSLLTHKLTTSIPRKLSLQKMDGKTVRHGCDTYTGCSIDKIAEKKEDETNNKQRHNMDFCKYSACPNDC